MKTKRPPKSRKTRHKAISLESGHLEGGWPGHFPVTSVALVSMLERVSAGEEGFSPAERILFVACEFWAAFQGGELDTYFDLKAEDPTRDPRIALRIMGAVKLANLLDRDVLGPPGGRADFKRRRRIEILEGRLRQISEPVDLLIARFAWRYMATQRPSSGIEFRPPPGAIENRSDPSLPV